MYFEVPSKLINCILLVRSGSHIRYNGSPPSGVQGQSPDRRSRGRKKLKLFVNECLHFDVLEEQISALLKGTVIAKLGLAQGALRSQ